MHLQVGGDGRRADGGQGREGQMWLDSEGAITGRSMSMDLGCSSEDTTRGLTSQKFSQYSATWTHTLPGSETKPPGTRCNLVHHLPSSWNTIMPRIILFSLQ